MTRKYGAKCMIEEAGVRSKEEVEKDFKKYTGKKQKYIMNELTYHHILEKYKGRKSNRRERSYFKKHKSYMV